MRGASQVGQSKLKSLFVRRAMTAVFGAAIGSLLALPSAAQGHGPPTTNTVGGHFLGTPPSVLSVSGPHLAPILPSVTSIPNYGFTNFGYSRWTPYGSSAYGNGYYRGRHGYGRGYGSTGLSYAIPYYIPVDGYGYDYVGGPELYSGPPIGPSDPILHMVAEPPPTRYGSADSDYAPVPLAQPQLVPQEQAAIHDVGPNEPSVLIFRDGRKREVNNYAIMGQTVYVFDKGTQKIALADLDVPATIKANDDRGLEFKLPPQKAEKKADIELRVSPEPETAAPANIASIAPS
jgi:hypothetical protein